MTNKKSYQWTNPVVENRADPYVMKHSDGYYYFIATVPEYDLIEIRRTKEINGLKDSKPFTVWQQHITGEMCQHIWAPELHYIDEKWYIYFAAAHSDNQWQIRIYVLECGEKDPLTTNWIEKGQIKTQWESFSLDATTFEHAGTRYMIWAQKDEETDGNSCLYMDEMINPWTLAGKQIELSRPEYSWERIGFNVNEGPAVLKTQNKIHVAFSASATDHNYCMGLLSMNKTDNPLEKTSWAKSEAPVFITSDKNGQYGPGHNSFVHNEESDEVIMFYHARNYKEMDGDPLNDPNRHTRAQYVTIKEDRIDFGEPVPDGPYSG